MRQKFYAIKPSPSSASEKTNYPLNIGFNMKPYTTTPTEYLRKKNNPTQYNVAFNDWKCERLKSL